MLNQELNNNTESCAPKECNEEQKNGGNDSESAPKVNSKEIEVKSETISDANCQSLQTNEGERKVSEIESTETDSRNNISPNEVSKVKPKAKLRSNTSEPNASQSPRASKRVRLQYQPFQSPESISSLMTFTSSLKSSHNKHNESDGDEKVLIYNKSEFLAVRNENNGFFVCRTYQNVYKESHKFRIQWFNNDSKSGHSSHESAANDIYTADFFDRIDFDCVLTNLKLTRVDKDQYRLPDEERQRTLNILQRAINVEKGIIESLDLKKVVFDGIDVSVVGKQEEKDFEQELLQKNSNPKSEKAEKKVKKKKAKSKDSKSDKTDHKTTTEPIAGPSKRLTTLRTKSNLKLKSRLTSNPYIKSKIVKSRNRPDRSNTKLPLMTISLKKTKVKSTIDSSLNCTPNKIELRPKRERKSVKKMSERKPQKNADNKVNNKKNIQTDSEVINKIRLSKRVRTQHQSYQANESQSAKRLSPQPSSTLDTLKRKRGRPPKMAKEILKKSTSKNSEMKVNSKTKEPKPNITKTKINMKEDVNDHNIEVENSTGGIVIFNRGEYLAIRNEKKSFFICLALQNIYKNSQQIKIRWFTDDNSPSIYEPDFNDHIDFKCILTNLTVTQVDKCRIRLSEEERQRTMNILQRAINAEKGIVFPKILNKVTPDGVDISTIGNPEERKKRFLKKLSITSKLRNKESNGSEVNKGGAKSKRVAKHSKLNDKTPQMKTRMTKNSLKAERSEVVKNVKTRTSPKEEPIKLITAKKSLPSAANLPDMKKESKATPTKTTPKKTSPKCTPLISATKSAPKPVSTPTTKRGVKTKDNRNSLNESNFTKSGVEMNSTFDSTTATKGSECASFNESINDSNVLSYNEITNAVNDISGKIVDQSYCEDMATNDVSLSTKSENCANGDTSSSFNESVNAKTDQIVT